MPWKRPENVPYPQTYAIVQGKKPLPNGKMPRFRIQDLTEEFWEDALVHMQRNFAFDEPYCAFLGLGNDPEARDVMAAMWRRVMASRCALLCLLDNPEEVNDSTLPRIVGVNMTVPETADHREENMKHEGVGHLIELMAQMERDVDIFNKFNVDVTLYALGLSVDRVFRGNNLGEEMLRARFPLMRAVGIPLTSTVFTATFSQQAAQRAGFELLLERKPDEYIFKGQAILANVKTNGAHLMAARVR